MTRNSLLAKFDSRYVGAAVAAAGAAVASQATEAAIVSFTPAGGVAIPVTTSGVYIDLETGATSNVGSGFFNATRPVLNLWGTSGLHPYFYPTTSTVNRLVANGTLLANLAPNTVIGPASTYLASRSIFTPGAPWNATLVDGLAGFRFLNNAGTATCYGWMKLSVNYSGVSYAGGSVTSWAYDCDPAATVRAGQVPEPASLSLLALGALGLIRRRRVA